MKLICNYIVSNFGFENLQDFTASMVHTKYLFLTIPSSFFLFTFIEQWLGITSAIFIAFLVLAVVELVTGLWGAIAKGQKWSSRKFSRFGLKILVWLSLIMVANSFVISYQELKGVQNYIIFQIFNWLKGVLVVYISFEYLISILENTAKITGQKHNKLLQLLNNKLDQFLGTVDTATNTDKLLEVGESEKDENADFNEDN